MTTTNGHDDTFNDGTPNVRNRAQAVTFGFVQGTAMLLIMLACVLAILMAAWVVLAMAGQVIELARYVAALAMLAHPITSDPDPWEEAYAGPTVWAATEHDEEVNRMAPPDDNGDPDTGQSADHGHDDGSDDPQR